MYQSTVSEGVTRVQLNASDSPSFSPLPFTDKNGEFLRLAECSFVPRPVWHLSGNGNEGEVRQTANGEVISFDTGTREETGSVFSAVLHFTYPGFPIITGL